MALLPWWTSQPLADRPFRFRSLVSEPVAELGWWKPASAVSAKRRQSGRLAQQRDGENGMTLAARK